MNDLFRKYGTNKCCKEEYMEVYNFMCNESIVEFMLNKLTPEELKYAKEKICKYKEIPDDELNQKVRKEMKQENYEKLSMVDAYVLHVLTSIAYDRSTIKTNSELRAQLEANEFVRQKSLYYASNPWKKR